MSFGTLISDSFPQHFSVLFWVFCGATCGGKGGFGSGLGGIETMTEKKFGANSGILRNGGVGVAL